MDRAPDGAIWREAERLGAVIVSKDADFAGWRIGRTDGPAVVWVRLGNIRTADLLRAFAAALPSLVEALQRGDLLVELA